MGGAAEREQFFELIEDEHRRERDAAGRNEAVVAVMEKFPERFAGLREIAFRPRAGARRFGADGLFHLLAERRRARRVIEAEVDRAEVGAAQPRKHAGLEQRRFAEARLPEEHRERIALHATREGFDLRIATEELRALRLGERREARPGAIRVGSRRGTLNVQR
ncbi:MAG: hypothetical protein HZA93_12650 [Verrucomicrobia bacterium]|nr:hypothetical protein [Verrucomicrobiota bacterium]